MIIERFSEQYRTDVTQHGFDHLTHHRVAVHGKDDREVWISQGDVSYGLHGLNHFVAPRLTSMTGHKQYSSAGRDEAAYTWIDEVRTCSQGCLESVDYRVACNDNILSRDAL